MSTMDVPDGFYVGIRWCSHDDDSTFHHDHWTCHLRTAILWLKNRNPRMRVRCVDYYRGVITLEVDDV